MAFRVLPRDLRPGRVGLLASALPGGLRDPGFEVLLRRIDASPIHRGNAVTLYFDGAEAFAAMGAAIEAAREEVHLEAYILKDDAAGRKLVDALEAAARRGVAVRVLADAFGSSATRRSFWRGMEEQHVDVRLFHPLFPYLWYQPYRDHRKILAVDRRVAFTGGMNVGEEYGSPSGATAHGRTWRDTHARVEGPAAWEMAVVFREGWEGAGGAPYEIAPLALAPDGEPAPAGASVLVLDSSPGRGHEETAAVIAATMAAARERFWLTNAYFAPRRGALPLLAHAARRGVDVRLLLPGVSDVPLVRHAGHGSFGALLRCGVRIFEYEASVLHAKSFVADGAVSMVGSTNMDFR
jgi:cardiolipin synthase A/B